MTMSKVPQIREPLATSTLILAGVPVQHVLWFKRLSPPAKMQALATEQGEQILNKRVGRDSCKTQQKHA